MNPRRLIPYAVVFLVLVAAYIEPEVASGQS